MNCLKKKRGFSLIELMSRGRDHGNTGKYKSRNTFIQIELFTLNQKQTCTVEAVMNATGENQVHGPNAGMSQCLIWNKY